MRLTFLTHTPEPGGSTSLLLQLQEFFDNRGHTTTVVVGSDGPAPAIARYTVVPQETNWRSRIARYKEAIERTKPDAVYSISGKDEFDVLRFLRLPRIRQISSLENNPYTDIRFWLAQIAGFTEAITANTPDVLEQIRSYNVGMSRGIIAPYRIASEFLAAPPSGPTSDPGDKKRVDVCYVGRLEPFLKRAHWLAPVALGLKNSEPPVRWHIYGAGPCEEKLRRDLRELERAGAVIFHGWRDKLALAREMPAHDIFFLCSRSEGLPVAMVEAMLCRLACVVPAYPAGITFALDKGGGWLYNARSPRDCIEALRSAIADRAIMERKKDEARRLAASLFAGPVMETYLNELEAGIMSLSFNGHCLDLERAPRMRSVRPWVALRRRIETWMGFPPERF